MKKFLWVLLVSLNVASIAQCAYSLDDEYFSSSSSDEGDNIVLLSRNIEARNNRFFDEQSLELYKTPPARVLFFVRFLASVKWVLEKEDLCNDVAKILCSHIKNDDLFGEIFEEIFYQTAFHNNFLQNMSRKLALLRSKLFWDETDDFDLVTCRQFCQRAIIKILSCYKENACRYDNYPIDRFLRLGGFFSYAYEVLWLEGFFQEKDAVIKNFFSDDFLNEKIKNAFAYNEDIYDEFKIESSEYDEDEAGWPILSWNTLGEIIRNGNFPSRDWVDLLLGHLMSKIKNVRAGDNQKASLDLCNAGLSWFLGHIVVSHNCLRDFKPLSIMYRFQKPYGKA